MKPRVGLRISVRSNLQSVYRKTVVNTCEEHEISRMLLGRSFDTYLTLLQNFDSRFLASDKGLAYLYKDD